MNPSDASGHDSTGCYESGASWSKSLLNRGRVYSANQDHLCSPRRAAEDRYVAAGGAFDEIKQCLIRLATFRRSRHPDSDRITVRALDLRTRGTGDHVDPQGCALWVVGDRFHRRNVPVHRSYHARQRRRFE